MLILTFLTVPFFFEKMTFVVEHAEVDTLLKSQELEPRSEFEIKTRPALNLGHNAYLGLKRTANTYLSFMSES